MTAAAGGHAGISVRDDAGKHITLALPAQRVVSLAPHATELIFAAGAGNRIVGTVRYSDYPAAARSIARVGDYHQIDLERVISLKPDLLVVWSSGNSAYQLAHLRKLGIPVFESEPRALDDVPSTITRLGQLMGTTDTANQVASHQRQQLAQLASRYGGRPVVRVFYQVWDQPLYTLNGQHIVSEAIRLCGGENIFAGLGSIAPTVTLEAVVQRNPEAIISGAQTAEKIGTDPTNASESAQKGLERTSARERKEQAGASSTQQSASAEHQLQSGSGLALWHRFPSMLATSRSNLFAIDADLVSRAGPRLITGTAQICEKLDQARARR